jgi:hypothetical protein
LIYIANGEGLWILRHMQARPPLPKCDSESVFSPIADCQWLVRQQETLADKKRWDEKANRPAVRRFPETTRDRCFLRQLSCSQNEKRIVKIAL